MTLHDMPAHRISGPQRALEVDLRAGNELSEPRARLCLSQNVRRKPAFIEINHRKTDAIDGNGFALLERTRPRFEAYFKNKARTARNALYRSDFLD